MSGQPDTVTTYQRDRQWVVIKTKGGMSVAGWFDGTEDGKHILELANGQHRIVRHEAVASFNVGTPPVKKYR